nr:hypothetical protein [uncultured Brumimicrobium sp.]
MEPNLIVNILAIVVALIVGVFQIFISLKQGKIEKRITKIEGSVIQIKNDNSNRGIIGNSNDGNISGNVIS